MPEKETLDATRKLGDSSASLLGLLTVVIAKCETLAKALESGESVYHATEAWSGSERMSEALADFEEKRRAWRVAVVRGWMAEDRSITAFAQTFGFSRQYAQRLAKEARSLD